VLQRIGRFEVQERIGEGAMADVYRAYDPSISRVLAIKVLKPQFRRDREYVARFLREAKAAGALSHPNIVTIFDVGEAGGHPYIAMELLDGEPLDRIVARRGRLPPGEVIAIGLQLAEALRYAHGEGVVHRDIKPSNIIVSGGGRALKILDFGIARLDNPARADAEALMTQAGQVLGTPRYMSPEQALGREIDGRSDLFSVGVVLYELITGQRAFSGANAVVLALQITQQEPEPIDRAAPDAPRGLQFVIGKLLSKRAERRYADGAQLAQALAREQRAFAAVNREAGGRRRNLPLQLRLALTMAAVTGLALALSIGLALKREHEAMRQMALTSGAAIASFVASNAALSAAENATLPAGQRDWLPVRAFVKAAAADPNIQALAVIDSDGRVRAASDAARVGQVFHPPQREPAILQDGDLTVTAAGAPGAEGFRFIRPIVYSGRTVGQVDVQVSQAPLKAATALSRISLGSLGLVVLGVVIAASYAMARLLANPIGRLRRAVNDAAAGDFDFRISHNRRDEFGELFNAFNQLTAEVHDRLTAAEMERRDRPLVIAGQPPAVIAGDDLALADADDDRTVISVRR
jgi:eukaryotic-like serine/threonine-protein kinase